VRLASLSRTDLLAARDALEAELEAPGTTTTLSEAEVRRMLRLLRYALGPNLDATAAHGFRVRVVVATTLDIAWTQEGVARSFRAEVDDADAWTDAVEREMRYLAELITVYSWGKIRLDVEVAASTVPITGVIADGTYLEAEDFAPPLIDAFGLASIAPCHFVFVPADGEGDPTNFQSVAYTSTAEEGDGFPPGASATVVHTTTERLHTDHGWAKRDGGGLVHELWHQMEGLMREHIAFGGFIPSNHADEDLALLLGEIREQGLPEPMLQYEELYATYPTWRMAQRIADF
jgi:hypothetical protein